MNMTDYNTALDVAYNDNIKKLTKVSYKNTIDIQFGVYLKEPYENCLTINLKPSKGFWDWIINFFAFPKKTPYGKALFGYVKEINKFWPDIANEILYLIDTYKTRKEIIISGRSKGAGEAELLIPYLYNIGLKPVICGAFEGPKCCDEEYSLKIKSLCPRVFETIYHNDIVPGIPFWFDHITKPIQIGERKLGLSIKDHIYSTTEKEALEI